jgi:hypothetical protein
MNQIAFYGGLVLVVVGLLLWIFRGGSPERNIIKLPGGIEFELNTPAFVVMAFGVVLVIISTWINEAPPTSVTKPSESAAPTAPSSQPFDQLGDLVRFGCEQDATSHVTYDAPSGWKIANANASVGSNSGDVKSQSATITKKDDHHVEAKADFRGRDKQLGLNCPSGGHGQVEIKGTIVKEI